jgi:hypothetical protein
VITASAPGYIDANTAVNIQPAALRFSGLLASGTAGGSDDAFIVQIGIPNSTGSNLVEVQNVRPGAAAVIVTVDSSDPAVGTLVTSSGTGGSVTLQIGPSQSQASGISFRPLSAGSTQVTSSAPNGVLTTDAGRVTVTVK